MFEDLKRIIKENNTIIRLVILSCLSILFSNDLTTEEMQRLPRALLLSSGFLLASMYLGTIYMKRMEGKTEAPILDAIIVFLFMIYAAISNNLSFVFLGFIVLLGIAFGMGGPEQFQNLNI